jgi:hypothetical protein
MAVQCSFGTVYTINSSITLHAEANAGLGTITDDDSVGHTSSLNSLSASVLARAVNGSAAASSQSTASASWSSAGAGQYSVRTVFASDNLPYQSARVAAGGQGLVYEFYSDVAATLTVDYAVSFTGFYAYGMHLYLERQAGGVRLADYEFSTSSGRLVYAVNANQNYWMAFYDGSNLNHFLPAFTSEMNGTFSYSIVPVPEPGTLALLGLGGGIWLLRRRRSPRQHASHRG